MSTDSTELTFIRCPSCRSLVPAVSPRCRMCGAVLDSGKADAAGTDDASAKKTNSRVRQQTVNVSDQDVKAVKQAFAEEPAPSKYSSKPETKVPVKKPEPTPSYHSEDEEVDQFFDNAPEVSFGSEVEHKVEASVVENTDLGDPLGAFIEEVPVEESIAAAPISNDFEENGFHDEPAEESLVEPEPVEEKPKVSKPVETKPSVSESRARVVIESGSRKPLGAKTGLSFGRNKPEVTRPVEEHKQEVKPAIVEEAKPPVEKSIKVEGSVMKPVEAGSKGRLYGWLVSYSDPRGLATELRDGKFFVSRSSLKGTDLILDDDSISTPHALIGVNVNDGLIVQDLMSDRGVFIRRKSGEAYQRVLESTKLEHGDWVRFGDVEFLVAIIG